jgi:hypothetical protein
MSGAIIFSGVQCQHVEQTPVYIKRIGGVEIDRSEWENEHGAFLRYEETPCHYVADPGELFCPLHKMEREIAAAAAESFRKIVPEGTV